MAFQELPFGGQNKTEESNNRQNVLAICEAIAEYGDSDLKFAKKNANCVFSEPSSDITNEIIHWLTDKNEGEN